MPAEEGSNLSQFLRPVAVKGLTNEEDTAAEPPAAEKRSGGGFRSDAFVEDLSEPAYTRKYMD
jgi:hypothetical protein